jgi:hypothetical protein
VRRIGKSAMSAITSGRFLAVAIYGAFLFALIGSAWGQPGPKLPPIPPLPPIPVPPIPVPRPVAAAELNPIMLAIEGFVAASGMAVLVLKRRRRLSDRNSPRANADTLN